MIRNVVLFGPRVLCALACVAIIVVAGLTLPWIETKADRLRRRAAV